MNETIKAIKQIKSAGKEKRNFTETAGRINKRTRGSGRGGGSNAGHRGLRSSSNGISQGNRSTRNQERRNKTVNRRNRSGTELAGTNSVGIHIKRLQNERSGETGIVQRIDYEEAMPMLEPTVSHFGKTGEGMCVRGSEYITDIVANTVEATYPASQGSCLYSIPLNPMFWTGSRVKKFYEMYRKYIIKDLVFELIPSVPSTTSGALLGVCSHDPDSNPTLIPDQDAQMRAFMAMKGAKIWNVYAHGRVSFTDDGTFGWYFTGDGQDAKLGTQGQFYIIVASPVGTLNEDTLTALGQLIVHYDIAFEDRIIDEGESGTNKASFTINAAASTVWGTGTINLAPFFLAAAWTSLGLTVNSNNIYILESTAPFLINNAAVLVDTEERTGVSLLTTGSTWYAYADPAGLIILCSNLGDALQRHQGVTLAATYNLANTMFGEFTIRQFITEYDE